MISQRFIRQQGERNKALADEALKPMPVPEDLRARVLEQMAQARCVNNGKKPVVSRLPPSANTRQS